jgi:site-specific recombinase XerD
MIGSRDEATPKYLDQEQVRAILKVARDRGPRDYALLLTVYRYGLRVSEASRLDRADLRLQQSRIALRRSKGSLSGELPLLRDVRAALSAYLDTRRDACPAMFKGKKGRLHTRQIELIFDACAEAAQVALQRGQSIHALRHSIAVHLLDAGWQIEQVQQHLGHRRIQNTLIYARISDGRKRELYAALEHSPHVVAGDL